MPVKVMCSTPSPRLNTPDVKSVKPPSAASCLKMEPFADGNVWGCLQELADMHVAPFDSPIHVLCPRKSLKKIHCAKEGFDFLLSLPVQEGPVFESALEACFAALSNPELSKDAHSGLAKFARVHGFLAGPSKARHAPARKLRVAWRNKVTLRPSAQTLSSGQI